MSMTKEMQFFLYLIERYANANNKVTGDVLKEWDDHNITNEIFDNYEMYHQERIENAFADINSLLMVGKHAW